MLVLMFHGTLLGASYFNHSLFGGFFRFGDFGVHFFFVLSGFLITYVHLGDLGRRGALKPYLIKRFVRVYPMYWVVLLPLLPIYFLIPSFGAPSMRDPGVIFTSLALVPHWRVWETVLTVAWTLRHEILFYALFALAIRAGRRVALWGLVAWVFVMALQTVKAWPVDGPLGMYAGFIFNRCNIEFVLGCVIGAISKTRGLPSWCRAGLPLGIALFTITVWIQEDPRSLGVFLAYAASAGLMVLGGAARPNSAGWAPMRLVGDASYAIYLVHYPALSLFAKVLVPLFASGSGTGRASGVVLVIMLSLATGIAAHLLVERPMLKAIRVRLARG